MCVYIYITCEIFLVCLKQNCYKFLWIFIKSYNLVIFLSFYSRHFICQSDFFKVPDNGRMKRGHYYFKKYTTVVWPLKDGIKNLNWNEIPWLTFTSYSILLAITAYTNTLESIFTVIKFRYLHPHIPIRCDRAKIMNLDNNCRHRKLYHFI